MAVRVLVAYATKLGSTAEIADVIAMTLCAAGHEAEAHPVRDVRAMAGWDAVVLGSALYAAHWQRDANRFVTRYGPALRKRPLWLFSSGPLDAAQAAANLPITPSVAELTDLLDVVEHRTFGGRLAPDAPIDPQVLQTHPIGDFRDWSAIREWARSIAAFLDRALPDGVGGAPLPPQASG